MKLTKKQTKIINRIVLELQRFGKDCGGWFSLFGRMAWNAIMLWVTFSFVKALILFSFISQDVPIPPERLELVGTIIWIIGIIYLVLKIPTYSEARE